MLLCNANPSQLLGDLGQRSALEGPPHFFLDVGGGGSTGCYYCHQYGSEVQFRGQSSEVSLDTGPANINVILAIILHMSLQWEHEQYREGQILAKEM